MAALAQITFPDALSFSIFAERLHSLLVCHSLSLSLSVSHTHTRAHTHIETTKPQRRESLVPSLSAEKKLSGWSARCISYHMYQKSYAQDFPFLIGRNLRDRDWYINFVKIKFLTKFYKKKVLTVWKKCFRGEGSWKRKLSEIVISIYFFISTTWDPEYNCWSTIKALKKWSENDFRL